MPRYALLIEYHGGAFSGWQWQEDRPSVQGVVEAAIAKLEPSAPRVAAAGRTDAGVHALGQVVTVDLERVWTPYRLCAAVNYHMKPHLVAVRQVAEVAPDFHARFSATGRRYLYRLVSRQAPLTVERGLAWQVPHALDLAAMQAGARYLLGKHDFTTFRSSMCQAESPVKTLDLLEISAETSEAGMTFVFDVRARSFLHNQVRSFVGTLERVGAGAWTPEDVRAALEARDRAACGPVCPPHGLYLAGVTYPDTPFGKTD